MVLLNTKDKNWDRVRNEIKRTHPYKVPCIVKIDAESNEDYKRWINESTR